MWWHWFGDPTHCTTQCQVANSPTSKPYSVFQALPAINTDSLSLKGKCTDHVLGLPVRHSISTGFILFIGIFDNFGLYCGGERDLLFLQAKGNESPYTTIAGNKIVIRIVLSTSSPVLTAQPAQPVAAMKEIFCSLL